MKSLSTETYLFQLNRNLHRRTQKLSALDMRGSHGSSKSRITSWIALSRKPIWFGVLAITLSRITRKINKKLLLCISMWFWDLNKIVSPRKAPVICQQRANATFPIVLLVSCTTLREPCVEALLGDFAIILGPDQQETQNSHADKNFWMITLLPVAWSGTAANVTWTK